jgi:hypothetical protein
VSRHAHGVTFHGLAHVNGFTLLQSDAIPELRNTIPSFLLRGTLSMLMPCFR